jgi:hypothetical protein
MNTESLSPEREIVEDLMAITDCFFGSFVWPTKLQKGAKEGSQR